MTLRRATALFTKATDHSGGLAATQPEDENDHEQQADQTGADFEAMPVRFNQRHRSAGLLRRIKVLFEGQVSFGVDVKPTLFKPNFVVKVVLLLRCQRTGVGKQMSSFGGIRHHFSTGWGGRRVTVRGRRCFQINGMILAPSTRACVNLSRAVGFRSRKS